MLGANFGASGAVYGVSKMGRKTRSKTAYRTLLIEPYRFLSSLQDRKIEQKKTLWDGENFSISQGHCCCVKLVSVVSLASGRDEGQSNLIFDCQGNRLLPGHSDYSYSTVAGGFGVKSYSTRLIPGTSAIILFTR